MCGITAGDKLVFQEGISRRLKSGMKSILAVKRAHPTNLFEIMIMFNDIAWDTGYAGLRGTADV